jgi:hypothetical protein
VSDTISGGIDEGMSDVVIEEVETLINQPPENSAVDRFNNYRASKIEVNLTLFWEP